MSLVIAKSEWRHRKNSARKVRVTRVWETETGQGMAVSFEILDPSTNEMPWRSSSVLALNQFLESYEPDIARPDRKELANRIAGELIEAIEKNLDEEAVRLRKQVEEVLEYMDHVTAPNVHTLAHIRHILTGVDDF
jgi:hypothetical protein